MKDRDTRDGMARSDAGAFQPAKRRLKTFWHYPYAGLVDRRKPPCWEAVIELILSLGPRWADLLLLRRKRDGEPDEGARVMRGLWRLLTDVALLELKGPTSGVRKLDLARLLSYGWEYISKSDNRVNDPSELSLVFSVPGDTPTLRAEYDRCRVTSEVLGGGYVRLHGSPFRIIVVLMDEVADSEDDDFLRVFTSTRAEIRDPEALRWMYTQVISGVAMEGLKHLEGFGDMVEQLAKALGAAELLRHFSVEDRLAGLEPSERLAGLEPSERLAGLEPSERLAGLEPSERLAGLDRDQVLDVLRGLPREVLEQISQELEGSQDDER